MNKKQAPANDAEVDHLEFVREALRTTPTAGWTRIAADAEVSIKTMYNLLDEEREPLYTTVKKLYTVLRAKQLAAA